MLNRLRPGYDLTDQTAELLPLLIAAKVELDAAVAETRDAAIRTHSAVASVRASLGRLWEDLSELTAIELPPNDRENEAPDPPCNTLV